MAESVRESVEIDVGTGATVLVEARGDCGARVWVLPHDGTQPSHFYVEHGQVSLIGPPRARESQPRVRRVLSVSAQQVRSIQELAKAGWTARDIARDVNLSDATVRKYLRAMTEGRQEERDEM